MLGFAATAAFVMVATVSAQNEFECDPRDITACNGATPCEARLRAAGPGVCTILIGQFDSNIETYAYENVNLFCRGRVPQSNDAAGCARVSLKAYQFLFTQQGEAFADRNHLGCNAAMLTMRDCTPANIDALVPFMRVPPFIPATTAGPPTTRPPTRRPTNPPTTRLPTRPPTLPPTRFPTTEVPTLAPVTPQPTADPTTANPTTSPTTRPTTASPTTNPTAAPTTSGPTAAPTTSNPTAAPTYAPVSCADLLALPGPLRDALPAGVCQAALDNGNCETSPYFRIQCIITW